MTDRTDTIRGLQRAARAEGRRQARSDAPAPSPAGRSRIAELRDDIHFQVLRVTELVRSTSSRTRRMAGGTLVATVLLVTVIGAVAGADQDTRPSKDRAAGTRAASSSQGRGTRADETLTGTVGNDRIDGRGGADVLLGAAGDDVLGGSTGDDVLYGGVGSDVLWAGPGRDVLIGADGDDLLRAPNLDGKVDRLHCGAGTDIAWVAARNGRIEDRTFGCERVNVINFRTVRRR